MFTGVEIMKSRIWLVAASLVPACALAWGNECKLRADRAGGVDATGVEKVVVRAAAGDLKIVGRPTAVRIEARGVACAAKQELLDATRLDVRREGNVVYVETDLPQNRGLSFGSDEYAFLDLGLALPSGIPVEGIDSSGDTVIEDLASLKFQDSSGDLRVTRIAGLADIQDSSGDLRIEHAGSVRLRDSSGDLIVEEVRGDVEVEVDSSGDMKITRVGGSVKIEQDSSGGIHVEDVKGSVTVESDSSGDVYAGRVGGDFTVGEDGSGSIEHSSIGGRVHLPSSKDDRDVE